MNTITSSCHCGKFRHTLAISPSTKLPLSETTCNCTSCRQRTGQIAIFTLDAKATDSIPSDEVLKGLKRSEQECSFAVEQAGDGTGLEKYSTKSGEESKGTIVTSYFCPTCGTKIYIDVRSRSGEIKSGSWMVGALSSMSLEKDGKETSLVDVKGHHFLGDTKDGGLSEIWTKAKGAELKRYHDSMEEWKKSDSVTVKEEKAGGQTEEYLNLHCRCKSFNVYVSRPDPELPLPKNCYWYRPPRDERGIPQRYMASWCACNSCRTTTGSSLPAHPWVQIPFADIHTSPSPSSPYLSTEMTSQTVLPGLTKYNSSAKTEPNIARYFCSTCGATVLYFDSERSFIGTWAVGLVDAEKEGVLAESWFNWWTGTEGHPNPPLHCKEDGEQRWGKEMMDEFEEGLVK